MLGGPSFERQGIEENPGLTIKLASGRMRVEVNEIKRLFGQGSGSSGGSRVVWRVQGRLESPGLDNHPGNTRPSKRPPYAMRDQWTPIDAGLLDVPG